MKLKLPVNSFYSVFKISSSGTENKKLCVWELRTNKQTESLEKTGKIQIKEEGKLEAA